MAKPCAADPADIYVTQDGPDFYVYADREMTRLLRTETYPRSVGLDLWRAQEARRWFEENGYFRGATRCHWPSPFA